MKHTRKTIKTLVFPAVMCAAVTASALSVSAVSFEEMDPVKILHSTVEDCQNTYKSYDIDDVAMFRLENGSDFKSVFTDTCRIFGQYESAYMMFIERNGKTEFVDAQGLPEGITIPNIEEEAKKLIDAQGYKVLDMIVGKSRDTRSYLVYFTTADGEYVLPIHDIKWSNTTVGNEVYDYIKEDKIYTTDEFVATLKKYNETFESLLMGDADGNGKVNIRDCSTMARAFAKHSNDMIAGKEWDYNKDGVANIRDCSALASDIATSRMKK